MIRTMLKPFLKKFLGLFISMAFVSMLAIGLLTAFASTIYNLKTTFRAYMESNEDLNVVASVGFTTIESTEGIKNLDSVKDVQYRLTMDAFLKKDNGRTITARIFTFKEEEPCLYKPIVLKSVEKDANKINVSVVRKYALNNGFNLGDTVRLGYFDAYLEFYVNEIVEVPEAIQARANNYVWSDTTDFGYVYLNEAELDKTIMQLSVLIHQKAEESEKFRDYYNDVISATGVTFPDIVNKFFVSQGFTKRVTNQILIKSADGYTEKQTADEVNAFLTEKDIVVKSVIENENMFYYMYIEHALDQLQVASVFLPVFFYAVTMIVIGLFINQIIKTMTPQIGVMMSVGVGKKDIISLFAVFTLLMSVVAGILGTGVGIVLNGMLANVMISVYSMPTLPVTVNFWIGLFSTLMLVVFAQIATAISCSRIFAITPKDATISNESKRKRLPARLERFIERAPMNVKLGVNSIAQNPRRFFVSVFSIFASFVIILLSMFFNVSKTELMAQTVDRRLSFDAQVYMTSVAKDERINDIRSQDSVKELIDCYYTYAEITDKAGKNKTYLECLAYDHTAENDMVIIPDGKGAGSLKITEYGIILPSSVADTLGVKAGEEVLVNGKSVTVQAVSFQYFHPITYLSKTQMNELELQCVSSLLVDLADNSEDAFLSYVSSNDAALTVFTSSLSRDIHSIFDSINVFIYIMIGFSLGMGFIILSIMSQNALMEQQRPLSVFRAIGFSIMDVSNLWTLQSVAQLILSSLFAVPAGVLVSVILFKMCSSATQIYPFVFSVPVVLFALAFIFAVILASHLISMFTIKRWNLANNTRSRE